MHSPVVVAVVVGLVVVVVVDLVVVTNSMHSPVVAVVAAVVATNNMNHKYYRSCYYLLLAVLMRNNSYYFQCLLDQNVPDHKLLLLALVRSQSRRPREWHPCSRDMTRNDFPCLGNYSKRSCHMKLIFASSYLTLPSVGVEYKNILLD